MAIKESPNDSFITTILSEVDKFFIKNNGIQNDINNLISVLLTIIASYMTCWIIYRGYKILWGKSNDNFKDFLWDAFLKCIFIYICLFPNDWIFLIKEAIQGFREIDFGQSGILSVPNRLQQFYNTHKTITINLLAYSNKALYVVAVLYVFIVWLGFFTGALKLISVLIANTISFYILLFVAPIAFYSLIFGSFLKNIFTQWFTMILSNIITLFFINIFCGFAIGIANGYAVKAMGNIGESDHYEVALVCLFAGICLKAFVDLIISLAEKMTNVSLETASMGAIKGGMGTLGASTGLSALVGKKGIRTFISSAKGSARAYDGIKTGGKFILDKIRKTGGR
ncbi:type IV secretion system protein [Campylobacter ureolyticus]|uniref:type IV secretion system protein n=1 Tax=Campylobacter ureolyticus TaxID=827 RepID=UPI0022B40678|nr:type IV secretion system protein [Campylobacter ureolyticus]MCZ6169598.1 type IV secretion system protein [Campylobacter ureolyticus]